MKDKDAKLERQLAKRPDDRQYEVGYGKPPDETRFQPGKSGNPKGRPKGRRRNSTPIEHERLQSIIHKEAYRGVTVNDGADQVTIPMAQAVIRSLAVTAAKGNTRAQKTFTELLFRTETAKNQADDERINALMKYKVDWEIESDRREKLGITNLPDPLPHPDDIIVDYDRNTILIYGPRSEQELAELDVWLKRKNDHEAELKKILQDKNDPEQTIYTDQLDVELTYTRRVLKAIGTALAMRASPECIRRRFSQLCLKPLE